MFSRTVPAPARARRPALRLEVVRRSLDLAAQPAGEFQVVLSIRSRVDPRAPGPFVGLATGKFSPFQSLISMFSFNSARTRGANGAWIASIVASIGGSTPEDVDARDPFETGRGPNRGNTNGSKARRSTRAAVAPNVGTPLRAPSRRADRSPARDPPVGEDLHPRLLPHESRGIRRARTAAHRSPEPPGSSSASRLAGASDRRGWYSGGSSPA